MKRIEHWVPGESGEDDSPLSCLRWPIPRGVTRTYVEAYTELADEVLVPYCQGAATVREIAAAGRRALAFHFDPALVLLVKAAVSPLPAQQLDAAVARLGDSLKHGVPLRQVLSNLYATTCPACLHPAVADYFVWDRELDAPTSKYVRCAGCSWEGMAAVEPEDRERLASVSVRGMHYHYVLDRVAPQPAVGELRSRLEPLLKLYSPRNLYSLAELTLKIDSLFPEGVQRQALTVLLLDCLDRCSSLHSQAIGPAWRERPSLSRTSLFLERNVWSAFEDAASRMQGSAPEGGVLGSLASTLESFLASDSSPLAYVGQALVRDLPRTLQSQGADSRHPGLLAPGAATPAAAMSARSFRLILSSPPPAEPAVWLLSCLWGGWALGAEAQAPLYALLRQRHRTADPGWYAGAMTGALQKLGSLLRDDGRLVLVGTGQDPVLAEALLFAANRAEGHLGRRLEVVSFVQSGRDYRLELAPLQPGQSQPTAAPVVPLPAQVQKHAAEAAAEVIRRWGEPVPWPVLHASVYRQLAVAHGGLLTRTLAAETHAAGEPPLDLVAEQVRIGLDSPAFRRLTGGGDGEELWWLADPAKLDPPLCDRVERAAYQALQDAPDQTETELAESIYVRFPGLLTPPPALVAACIRNCGYEVTSGRWRLRPEDEPTVRTNEQRVIVGQLLALGQRLGYQVGVWGIFDVAWFDAARAETPLRGQPRAAFAVRWQAAVSEVLFRRGMSSVSDAAHLQGVQAYLVIPGGRAALVSHKLAHNPIWQAMVDEAGWRFIKYRHVRELAAQPDVDEYALRTIIGLDPIVEKEGVQLALF